MSLRGLLEDKKMISVIVPVYNVEKYIRECLDSILSQTISSFELILVDDGSTDNSGQICDEYAQKDDRIRVFHKENGGLSSARNKGLDEVRGDYICFVDSDDRIRRDYLEKLYAAVSLGRADLAFCDIEAPKLAGAGYEYPKDRFVNLSPEDAGKWLYDDRTRDYVLMVVAWNKMYSKEIFDGLRFPEGRIHEDEFMIGPVLSRCGMLSFVPDKLYDYRDNATGITSSANRLNINHLDCVDALVDRIRQALDEENREFAIETLKNALYKCARFYGEAKECGYKDLLVASNKKYVKTYNSYKGLFTIKQRMKYFFFVICPSVFIMFFNP